MSTGYSGIALTIMRVNPSPNPFYSRRAHVWELRAGDSTAARAREATLKAAKQRAVELFG